MVRGHDTRLSGVQRDDAICACYEVFGVRGRANTAQVVAVLKSRLGQSVGITRTNLHVQLQQQHRTGLGTRQRRWVPGAFSRVDEGYRTCDGMLSSQVDRFLAWMFWITPSRAKRFRGGRMFAG